MKNLSSKFKLLQLLTFFCLTFSYIGCAGEDRDAFERECVSLCEDEWLFYKNEDQITQIDSGKIREIEVKDNEKVYQGFEFEIPDNYGVEKFRLRFNNQIAGVKYRVESSNDGFKSDVKDVFQSGRKVVKPVAKFASVVTGVASTVGYSNQFSCCYVEKEITTSDKKVRIILSECKDSDQKDIKAQLKDVQLVKSGTIDKNLVVSKDFDDSSWEKVGVPHCYNDSDSYLNVTDAESYMWRGEAWYRKELDIDDEYKGKRVMLEFESVNVGSAIYVNGHFVKGSNYNLTQPDEVTHVGCFLPFTLDITDYIEIGEKNILAVRVSNAPNSFFVWPDFGIYSGFGMGFGGIVAPVKMHVMDQLHIPHNTNSFDERWGTYVATEWVKDGKAKVRVQTQVVNDSKIAKKGVLKSSFEDKKGKSVVKFNNNFSIAPGESYVLDTAIIVDKANLWFPNNSPFGEPYMYNLESRVVVDGTEVDKYETPFGMRVISWDDDYCYVNGEKHFLRGFGNRNTYPALGSAVPALVQWIDIRYARDCGANLLRVGHVPATLETLRACDQYGIMVFQDSGDNEWDLKGDIVYAYKPEYDRNMILSMRNHPSIIVWEANNGIARGEKVYTPDLTLKQAQKYDPIQTRIVMNRDNYPKEGWDSNDRIVVGYTNRYKKVEGSPTINTEVYGAVWNGDRSQCIYRFDYENEKKFSQWYIDDYLDDIKNRACGWIDWMLAETQGEGYTIYLDGTKRQKSLGSSAMDGNRFPKLKYNIYKEALWIDAAKKPGVVLQTNWNISGVADIDAWSNCRLVELFVGGKSLGVRVPDPETKRCTWKDVDCDNSGDLVAVGMIYKSDKAGELDFKKSLSKSDINSWNDQNLAQNSWIAVCEDRRVKAGEPYSVVLTIDDRELIKPNGEKIDIDNNGSDVVLVTAKIVDKKGALCTNYNDLITFDVAGEGIYKGSYNFLIEDGFAPNYHAPLDKELRVEGGLMKVAIRTTFKDGEIKVTAKSGNLQIGKVAINID